MDVQKTTEKTIRDGGILAMLYFDLHAATKEAAQQLGTGFVDHLIKTPGVVYALGEIDEPLEGGEGKNCSTSIAVKILTKDFLTLAMLCMNNSPFSVEILRPDEIRLPLNQVHELLGTLAATTAEYKKYIVTKIAKPEEIAEFQRQLGIRAELGKKILEKKGEKRD
ncbi:hypothetical protein H0O02_03225 [Candidatus Micrarchaeota archaeon]|nr:hypothetical protein [Candidatus Micrarchaeota archaeon]